MTTLFEGAAPYYAKYRLRYPAEVIRNVVSGFALNGDGKVIDVGCGTGQLAIRLTDWSEHIAGIDIDGEMLREAQNLAEVLKIKNIDWVLADSEDYIPKQEPESIKLITMGKSFHWLNRPRFLTQVYDCIQKGGGIAIIDDYQPNKRLADWQFAFHEVIQKWYGKERRAGSGTYSHPIQSHEEVIEQSKFTLHTIECKPYHHTWTIETLLGHHYSTSYGLKTYLGSHVESFEAEVKNKLVAIHPDGRFNEEIKVKLLLGYK